MRVQGSGFRGYSRGVGAVEGEGGGGRENCVVRARDECCCRLALGVGLRTLGFGVWGLGFGVWGLGFGVWGLGFGVWGLGFGVGKVGFEFRVLVQGAGVWVWV